MFRLIALRLHIEMNIDMLLDAADDLDDGIFFVDDDNEEWRAKLGGNGAVATKGQVFDAAG